MPSSSRHDVAWPETQYERARPWPNRSAGEPARVGQRMQRAGPAVEPAGGVGVGAEKRVQAVAREQFDRRPARGPLAGTRDDRLRGGGRVRGLDPAALRCRAIDAVLRDQGKNADRPRRRPVEPALRRARDRTARRVRRDHASDPGSPVRRCAPTRRGRCHRPRAESPSGPLRQARARRTARYSRHPRRARPCRRGPASGVVAGRRRSRSRATANGADRSRPRLRSRLPGT